MTTFESEMENINYENFFDSIAVRQTLNMYQKKWKVKGDQVYEQKFQANIQLRYGGVQ